jgi:hypothetical protein
VKKYYALIVTGTREPLNEKGERFVDKEMAGLLLIHDDCEIIIHGDCPTGVDAFVAELFFAAFTLPMPAPFDTMGSRGGPFRNEQMMLVATALRRCNYTVEGIAFPYGESPGTRGCMKLMKGLKIPVTERKLSPEHIKS